MSEDSKKLLVLETLEEKEARLDQMYRREGVASRVALAAQAVKLREGSQSSLMMDRLSARARLDNEVEALRREYFPDGDEEVQP